MQITENTHPALMWIRMKNLDQSAVLKNDYSLRKTNNIIAIFNTINNNLINKHNDYSINIKYISNTLAPVIKKSTEKLKTINIFDDFTERELRRPGVILFEKLTFFFDYSNIPVIYAFWGKVFVFYSSFKADGIVDEWFTSQYSDITYAIDDKMAAAEFYELFTILFKFMKYCKIETKIIKPLGREKINNEKYVNNSSRQITIVDSTWYTNLVCSGAFNVTGHFRLQPYKTHKDLIWISDYEKTGYTRNAKKLSFYPQEETIKNNNHVLKLV